MMIGSPTFNPIKLFATRKRDGRQFLALIPGPFDMVYRGGLTRKYNRELRTQDYFVVIVKLNNTGCRVLHISKFRNAYDYETWEGKEFTDVGIQG